MLLLSTRHGTKFSLIPRTSTRGLWLSLTPSFFPAWPLSNDAFKTLPTGNTDSFGTKLHVVSLVHGPPPLKPTTTFSGQLFWRKRVNTDKPPKLYSRKASTSTLRKRSKTCKLNIHLLLLLFLLHLYHHIPSTLPKFSLHSSFHLLSAGGPYSSRPAHFREAIASDRGNALLSTMTRIINLLSAGKAPRSIMRFMAGGNLFAALKKIGGHRPIAVGETLRRWVAKCVAKKAVSDSANFLAPSQVGVCVKGGAEAIIHATASIYDDPSISIAEKWVLQVDFDNAFNRIDGKTMLEMIQLHCPKAAAWAEFY